MMLPVFILVADVAAWWLASYISSLGDTALTLICGLLAVALVAWLLVEVYLLSENAIPGRDSDGN